MGGRVADGVVYTPEFWLRGLVADSACECWSYGKIGGRQREKLVGEKNGGRSLSLRTTRGRGGRRPGRFRPAADRRPGRSRLAGACGVGAGPNENRTRTAVAGGAQTADYTARGRERWPVQTGVYVDGCRLAGDGCRGAGGRLGVKMGKIGKLGKMVGL